MRPCASVRYLIKHADGNAYYYGLTKTKFPEPNAGVYIVSNLTVGDWVLPAIASLCSRTDQSAWRNFSQAFRDVGQQILFNHKKR